MTTREPPRISLALVHYPVFDKHGGVYTTSLTNLDVHDIGRASRTFGLNAYYIVHPITVQRELASSIAAFWKDERGISRNPDRSDALSLVRVHASIEDVIVDEREKCGGDLQVLSTSAKQGNNRISYRTARATLPERRGTLLIFGTGHGLAPSVEALADATLAPISGPGGAYNHLSVRSAVAIILDRLLGSETVSS